ncbi:unnamed protein product [Fusarium venenatum]|uniref:Uncharacterized protein n=1 Tax=Fusarium venenatum TaxID=56646 RepID=A0A2L2TEH1_9HYPO|nr:uncharacterized protein FVRRES_12643 [Fusarium venenatum]CEI39952.1 unnamed protein product [Fusarium venenatum]
MRTQGIDAIEARMGWLQIDDKFQTPGIFDVEMTHLPNDQSHTIPQESTSSEMSNLKPSDATKVLSLTSFFLIWQRGHRVFATGMVPVYGEIDKLRLSLGP